MLIGEHPGSRYLVGGVDELSGYHYLIEQADGWYKTAVTPDIALYDYGSPGSIAGEGAALFLVSGEPAGALAALRAVDTFHSSDERVVADRLRAFLDRHMPPGSDAGQHLSADRREGRRLPDERLALFLSGENGDSRALPFYTTCETVLDPGVPVARYKHLCGEYPTASAFAVWLALQLELPLPSHLIKKTGASTDLQYILLYNNHKLVQHSFMLLERFP
jgi:hypothetical protein